MVIYEGHVECSGDYLELCVGKVFKSLSKKRRILVEWPQRQRDYVERKIKSYVDNHLSPA